MLPHRPLGQTDIHISPLGLGTVKFGRNTDVKYPNAFDLPSNQQIQELLAVAQDANINLIDTAPAYGTSEQRLGQCLKTNRHTWVIANKVGEFYEGRQSRFDFTPHIINQTVEQSLTRLNTDYIDILLIHSDGNDIQIIEQFDVFHTLEQLKKRGLIRAYGMSTKTIEGGLKTLEYADVVMASYHLAHQDELPILEYAKTHNKGVLLKKAFASGHLQTFQHSDPIQASLDFIFQSPQVNSVVVGTINPQHLLQNAKATLKALTNATI